MPPLLSPVCATEAAWPVRVRVVTWGWGGGSVLAWDASGNGPGSGFCLRLADPGGAGVADDVGIELVAEVPDDAPEGEGGATLVVAQGAVDDVGREVGRVASARRRAAGPRRFGLRSRPAGAVRSGTGSSCRRPRRRRSGSGPRPDRRRSCAGRRPRSSPTRCARPPLPGRPDRKPTLMASAGRMPPDGPPTSSALRRRWAGTPPATSTISWIVTPSGTSAMPGLATAPEIWTRIVPRLAVAPTSAKRSAPPVRIEGTAANVCGPWISVGLPKRPRVVV